MKEFFNNILSVFRGFGSMNKHQKILFYGSNVVYMLLGLIFGYLSSIIFTLLVGLGYELTYCYVPATEIVIFGKYITVPDYIKFKNEFSLIDTKVYNNFSSKNIYFCVDGVIVGIIIRIILAIL